MIHSEETRRRRLPGVTLFIKFSSGCVPVWGHSRGRTPVAEKPEPVSGMGRSPSVSSDQTQPSLGIFFFFCQQLLDLLELPAKLGFIPFFFPCPLPLLLGTPGLFPFLDRALKLWNSLLLLTPAF